ncbi:hypothetical protein FHS40_009258, partial [Streptomyces spectabilis]|nr:hypothetical protein [Streptomyces spectabilis]
TATALETNQPVDGYQPFVSDEDELTWEIL